MTDTREFSEALARNTPLVVDFWAEWCAPCKTMSPVIDSVSKKLPHVTFLKVNIEEHKHLAEEHGIRSLPTCIVFHEGKEIGRLNGALPEVMFHQKVRETLQKAGLP